MDPTSIPCTFLGYTRKQKAYVLRRDDSDKVIVSRNVTFDEHHQSQVLKTLPELPEQSQDPLHTQEELSAYAIERHPDNVPRTFAQAMTMPDAKQWRQAAEQEMKAHHDNNTWTLVDKPPNAKVIKGRWVFTKKKDQDKEIHKARYVAKGFSQTAGIDYHETFAAVLSLTALRLLIVLAVTFGWDILQKDFKTAYLNALLLIPIYMQQPEGFAQQGGGRHLVCLLNKALYGLKRAGRAWQHALFDLLIHEGYQQSKKEPCIWFKRNSPNLITILAIYVDDLLLTGNDSHEIKRISSAMGNAFRMKHLGKIKQFLGITATHKKDGITLTQEHYINEILKKFKQTKTKGADTPMQLTYQHDDLEETNGDYPIREAIGCLNYLANATRPDIAFAVNNIARHMTKPTKRLWRAVQRVIKYLAITSTIGIHYSNKTNLDIIGHCDSDFAGDTKDRKSTTGWTYAIGVNTVSWKTSKQPAVTLSTTEAEYYAACDAAKEALWLDHLLHELNLHSDKRPLLHQDNQGAIFIESNHCLQQRTKHIDIKYHFIKDLVKEGKIKIKYCPTKKMTADILTKPLPITAFTQHRNHITNTVHNDNQEHRDDGVTIEEEC
jgi:hypothetical protein